MRIFARFTVRWTALLLALIASIVLVSGARFVAVPHLGSTTVLAAELKPIQLPKPEITGGMPLMQALSARKTTRVFLDKPLPPQMLSNLLWAAFGVNRPKEVKPGLGRTAPSGRNTQDITLEVALADGSTSTTRSKTCCAPCSRAMSAAPSALRRRPMRRSPSFTSLRPRTTSPRSTADLSPRMSTCSPRPRA